MSEMKKIYITGLWITMSECTVFRHRLTTLSNGVIPGIPEKMLQVSGWTASLLPMPNCMVRITTVISATLTKRKKSWNAGAIAKSITHLKGYSLTGSFSFDHTSGKDMSGSMFIHPGFYPVDLLEFTPGRKDLQTLRFHGWYCN